MKRIGVRYAPETVEELSGLVWETRGPIAFGVGRESRVGWPTELRVKALEGARTIVGDPWPPYDQAGKGEIAAQERFYGDLTPIELSAFQSTLEFEPENQVVRCGVRMQLPVCVLEEPEGTFVELQSEPLQRVLAERGQCLPFAHPRKQGWEQWVSDESGHMLYRGIALNFPHSLQTQCGSWRDWVLGMTVVLADGTIVKTGSKAVKSVAGYDVHKLMIGAYDTLGIVVDVTLRTFPLKALPEPDLTWGPAKEKFKGEMAPGKYVWRQRVLQSHYQDALSGAGDNLLYADNAGCTLWCWLDSPDQELPRYPGDWVVRTGCGEKNVQITDPTQIRFMKRAKQIFDPEGKLNPGEFGFL